MPARKPRPTSPAPPLTKDEFEALAQFRYELRRFLRFSEQATHSHGVTPLHYLLLLQIKGYPGREWATITELAERLQAKHHGVVSLVTRCEAAGLVRRSTSAEDRRRVEVRLTAKGAKLVERVANLHRLELMSFRDVFLVSGVTSPRADRSWR
ncbi:MAG: MarR family transcriptional regulator [Betaproteobacteria bacterium]|jgi:DNA-binding MarR family transcriptional regulator|nr:MarR family transcriptional regulator [Betaproteobacteria bacterium]